MHGEDIDRRIPHPQFEVLAATLPLWCIQLLPVFFYGACEGLCCEGNALRDCSGHLSELTRRLELFFAPLPCASLQLLHRSGSTRDNEVEQLDKW